MGEHKRNPVAIAAAKGELPPKPKQTMSKRKRERLVKQALMQKIDEKTGLLDHLQMKY